jgi:hypothetical protein
MTDEEPLFDVTDSVAIRRMIEEVRLEEDWIPHGYNRTYNRHNRSGSSPWQPLAPPPKPTLPEPDPPDPNPPADPPP